MKNYILKLKNIIKNYLTILRGKAEISKTREVSTQLNREVKMKKPVMESLCCPYCSSKNFQKRGFRQKKLERVQLYLCLSCNKTFTSNITHGKHYPLAVMLDAISIYNLGYSLEQSCKIVNQRLEQATKKSACADLVRQTDSLIDWSKNLENNITLNKTVVNSQSQQIKRGVDLPGIEPGRLGFLDQSSKPAKPTPDSVYQITIQPSTLSNWLSETIELCKFNRMREFALRRYSPKEMVIYATLAHRQLYRYRFHRAKCELMISEEFQHRKFESLKEFLEMVPVECPHQYFQEGLRASEAPLTFSKKQMIVRAKQNYATRLCSFVLQSVKERKQRHEALQKFMLCNDSVTVATEVPVYLTKDDLLHMQTQLGFEIYEAVKTPRGWQAESHDSPEVKETENKRDSLQKQGAMPAADGLPSLITGHIDILQIRNGQIHILDYKPNAEKERPIEQLTLYAMALSRLTGLRLFEFKCAWFDEKDYFEFYPLHVLYKPRRNLRRRKVYTMEGTYQINRNINKIEQIRPNL